MTTKSKPTEGDKVAQALLACFVTPNESDSNWESPGPTDGLFEIARAIRSLAKAIEGLSSKPKRGDPNGQEET